MESTAAPRRATDEEKVHQSTMDKLRNAFKIPAGSTEQAHEDSGLNVSQQVLQSLKGAAASGVGELKGFLMIQPKYLASIGCITMPQIENIASVEEAYETTVALVEYLKKANYVVIEDWETWKEAIERKEVHISTIGRNKAGKSTMLNALMHARLLPAKVENATAKAVSIECCRVGETAKLFMQLPRDEHALLAEGTDSICAHLDTLNQEVRMGRVQTPQQGKYILKTYIEAIGRSGSLTAVTTLIVDLPGIDEASPVAILTTEIERGLSYGSAYIFVISCNQLQNCRDLKAFQDILQHDKAALQDGRILFVVTKFDEMYDQISDHVLAQQAIYASIAKEFQKAGYSLDRWQVVAVSGLWGLVARQLKRDPNEKQYLRDARKCFVVYKSAGPCGEGDDPIAVVCNTLPEQIAGELEAASHIRELEFSLKTMTERCGEILQQNRKSKSLHLAGSALTQLKAEIEATQASLDATEAKMTKLRGGIELYDKRKQKIAVLKDDFLSSLVKKYKEEVKAPRDAAKAFLEKYLAECERHCLETRFKMTVQNGSQPDPEGENGSQPDPEGENGPQPDPKRENGPQPGPKEQNGAQEGTVSGSDPVDLLNDMNTFISEAIQNEGIQEELLRSSFELTHRVYELYVLKIGELFKEMGMELEKYEIYSSGTYQQGQPLQDQQLQQLLNRKALKTLKDILSGINLARLLHWKGFREYFSSVLRTLATRMSFEKVNCRAKGDHQWVQTAIYSAGPVVLREDVEPLFVRVRKSLMESCDEYFDDNEEDSLGNHFIETFNKMYEAKAKEQLGKMEEKYGESVKKNRKEQKTCLANLERLQAKLADLKKMHSLLQSLAVKLNSFL